MPSCANDNRLDRDVEGIGSQNARSAVVLFSRVPIPGRTKTRLHSILSPEECAALHEAMARDLAEKLAALGNPLGLRYSDEWRNLADGEEDGKIAVDLAEANFAACADAVENTAVNAVATKVIRNGQIVIVKDGVEFNVLGTQVK